MKNKIVLWPLIAAVVCAALALFSGIMFKNSIKSYGERPENNYINYLENKEYDKAISGYDESKISKSKKDKYKAYAVELLDKEYDNYRDDAISYDEVMVVVNCLSQTALSESDKITIKVEQIEELKSSKESYMIACTEIGDTDPASAFDFLARVSKLDNNYPDAQSRMRAILEENKEAVVGAIVYRRMMGSYEDSLFMADAALSILSNDEELLAEKATTEEFEHIHKMQSIIDEIIATYFDGNNIDTYLVVVEKLEEAMAENNNDDILVQRRNDFANEYEILTKN